MTFLRLGILISLQVLLTAFIVEAERSNIHSLLTSNATNGVTHAPETCSMYGICGARSDGKILNCPLNAPSVKPDALFSSKIQSLCPTITGNVCCTEEQFDTLRTQVQQAIPLLVGCPACLRNFLNIFCEMSCSPNQSLFINVTSVKKVNNNLTVDAVEYYVTDDFGEGLYNSCKDVKFGTMNTLAIEFIAGGAPNFRGWYAFLGRQVGLNVPGSPYAINFTSSIPESSGMSPMNVSAYSCSDTSLGCSCGDCPSSSTCSSSASTPVSKSSSCSIKMGSVKAKCSDVAVAVVYIVLVSLFLGWGFVHQKKGMSPVSKSKPLTNATTRDAMHSEDQKDAELPLPILLDEERVYGGVKLSVVEGYMSNFYRKYGAWVARRPALVLFSSLSIVLVLCIGLIRFKVETRPEKLWVGPGSRAAKEKQFFDSHLAPFYRIEQLIIATVPDGQGKSPSVLTENNIKLLFDIQKKVDGIRANFSGSMVSLTDICTKPLGQECATQSILQYFKMNLDNFDDYGGVDHVEYCFEHFTSTETCLSAFKAPLDPSTALGGYSRNNFSEASAFIVTYPVSNVVDSESNEAKRAVVWEKAFIQLAKEELMPMVHSKNLTLSFSSESSIEEELKRESTADVITIVISYLVMFAYISLTLGDTPRLSSCFISSKVLLGLSGVILVMLSVLGSVGFFSAVGVKSTLIIMEVIPFLVLAVGVDNMCILVHAVKRQSLELPLEGRISNALVEVGPSISLASLSEVLAFAVGTFIPMPAVRVFSMFAALAVLLDFLLQVTAFVALIVFDFLRTEDHRVDCFPCVKVPSTNSNNDSDRRPGLLARYMKNVHAPILSLWGVKVLVVCAFAAFAFASIALCSRIEPGLEQQIVLPRDSYLQGYFKNISDFLRIGPPVYFVVKDFNYSSESRQTNQLCSISRCDSNSLVNEISRASLNPESTYLAKPAASWLDDFLVWISPEAFGCCRKFTNGSYCPPNDQPPCCSPDQVTCGVSEMCRDCTTCFLHSQLVNDRPATAQFKDKLPWFLNALPSADCAKGGHGAYTNSVYLQGWTSFGGLRVMLTHTAHRFFRPGNILWRNSPHSAERFHMVLFDGTGSENGIIGASEFRTYHTPLNKQSDFVNALKAARQFSSRVSKSLQMEVFPYSVFYIFFEQYLDIWRTALINLAIAIGAVFVVCLIITWSIWSSLIILLVITMMVLDLLGVMALLKIQLNAVSVVNLIMSVGIAVEFCVHITHAFMVSRGTRDERMKQALGTMGASVFSGITLTKLVGVIVLAFSRSEVFVVYYFQMYLALVLLGFLHGLIFLPVILSLFGPRSRYISERQDPQRPSTSSHF